MAGKSDVLGKKARTRTNSYSAIETDWRAGLSSGKQCKLRMLEHGIHSDCVIKVGPEGGKTQEFRAHRLFLTCASPVFQKMFETDPSEGTTASVRITDIEPHIFNQLLIYAYVDLADLSKMKSFDNTNGLALAAYKFQMTPLFEECVNWMCTKMRPDHVWSSLTTAQLSNHVRLQKATERMLQGETMYCLMSKDFLRLDESKIEFLLSQTELNVESETMLVSATINWARHEAKRRGLTGDDAGVRAVLEPRLLKLMRLLSLSHEHFALDAGLSEWLTDEEKKWIYGYNETQSKDTLCAKYLSHTSQPRIKPKACMLRANTTYCLSYDSPASYFIAKDAEKPTLIFKNTFSNSKLHSVGLVSAHTEAPIFSRMYDENLFIQILVYRNSSWVHLAYIHYLNEVPSNSTITVELPQAIDIIENTWHVLQVSLNNEMEYGVLSATNKHYYLPLSAQKMGEFTPTYENFFTNMSFSTS